MFSKCPNFFPGNFQKLTLLKDHHHLISFYTNLDNKALSSPPTRNCEQTQKPKNKSIVKSIHFSLHLESKTFCKEHGYKLSQIQLNTLMHTFFKKKIQVFEKHFKTNNLNIDLHYIVKIIYYDTNTSYNYDSQKL